MVIARGNKARVSKEWLWAVSGVLSKVYFLNWVLIYGDPHYNYSIIILFCAFFWMCIIFLSEKEKNFKKTSQYNLVPFGEILWFLEFKTQLQWDLSQKTYCIGFFLKTKLLFWDICRLICSNKNVCRESPSRDIISLYCTLFYYTFLTVHYFFFFKLRVCGNHVLSKSFGILFPTVFAHFMPLSGFGDSYSISNFFYYYYICYGSLCQWLWLANSSGDS